MKPIHIFCLCAAISVVPRSVSAFTNFSSCNGAVKWSYAPNFDVDSCTITQGDAVWNAIVSAKAQWDNVAPSHIGTPFSIQHFCSLTYGDGVNEVMLVDQATLGSGFMGFTQSQVSTCFFSAGTYTESDIILLNTANYSPQDESFWGWSHLAQGAVVTTHEFGHFIGLGHDQTHFNIVRSGEPLPLAGNIGGSNTSAQPYPDDANGARWLYPSTSRTNVFASAQEPDANNNAKATNNPGTITVCRGAQFSLDYTVANNGNTNVGPVGFRIFMTPTPPTGGTNLVTTTAISNAGNFFKETRMLTVPSTMPNGTYWILWEVDTGHAVTEWNEGDNMVHSAMTINVNC